ncbi:MAG: hypothetical protein HS108_02515 [Planctomycetes bacterium]|nr:hypothetical protein [Planctomycetota bacterium]MCL4729208.1 hypothetical protein [Planctomycetota bacterium]
MGLRAAIALCLLLACPLAAQADPRAPKPDIAELWKTGCLWEVGDNRETVPAARKALIEAGEPALAHALTRLGARDTLETRCLSAVFAGWKADAVMAPKALAGLLAHVGHEDQFTRRNVADLLDQFDDRAAMDPLLAQARKETAEGVRMAQLAPLARWKDPNALDLLVTASRTGLERLRSRASTLLLHYDEQPAALDRLVELLADEVYYVADAAASGLKTASVAARRRCLTELGRELARPRADQRAAFVRQLLVVIPTLADADTPMRIAAALAHADAGVRADAAEALATWKLGAGLLDKTHDARGALDAALKTESDPFARAAINRALQRLTDDGKKE